MLDLWILNSGSSLSRAQAPDCSAILPGSKTKSLDKMTSKGLSSSNNSLICCPISSYMMNKPAYPREERKKDCLEPSEKLSHEWEIRLTQCSSDDMHGTSEGTLQEESAAYISENFLFAILLGMEVCTEVMTPLS